MYSGVRLKDLKPQRWFEVSVMGILPQSRFPFLNQTQKFFPWSRARLMAEGHWGLDWEVTDSVESQAVI